MVRLNYDLDAIGDSPYVPGKCPAELKKVTPTISRGGNSTVIFEWLILRGPNKKLRIKDYVVLLGGSGGLERFRERLKALGVRYKNGEVVYWPELIGQQATLVLAERPTTKKGRTDPFVGVSRVLPLE